MKRIALIMMVLLTPICATAQLTATGFNVSDCQGTVHNLFSELDNGKIVVMVWVMPCGSCIAPALTAYSVVQKFSGSNPGKVLYYLVDDQANTNCATLSLWAKTNEINDIPVFSDAAINMWDYGSAGMPKIVAIAGMNHEVIYNHNTSVNASELTAIISTHLPAGTTPTAEPTATFSLFPNPLTDKNLTINYTLTGEPEQSLEIYNAVGSRVRSIILTGSGEGEKSVVADLGNLDNGVYFVRLKNGRSARVSKLIINR